MSGIKVAVIGCGVAGLTCGVLLLEAGFQVTIVAHRIPPATTSNVAAAVWYPYLAAPQNRVLTWCSQSYATFLQLSQVRESGVSLIPWHEVFAEPISDPYWASAVLDYRRLGSAELPSGYVDGYTATVPLIETPLYLPYLMNRFAALGGIINRVDREIRHVEDLYPSAPLVINCAGIGARELCRDVSVYPIRGQVLSVTNPDIKRGIADDVGPLRVAYVIPRSKDCILGGTAQVNDWNMEIDEETSQELLYRCRQLEPKLERAEIIEAKVGLRPGRKEIRLEIEHASDGCAVIHNYGHGGAGFTLSWGCAEEVVALACKNFPAYE